MAYCISTNAQIDALLDFLKFKTLKKEDIVRNVIKSVLLALIQRTIVFNAHFQQSMKVNATKNAQTDTIKLRNHLNI